MMEQVATYITSSRAAGTPDGDIAHQLRHAGWTDLQVAQAFAHVQSDAAQEPIITVSGLTKRYGEFVAVDDISFHVERGEVFGILGPNGAGKTTTLEMIEGLKQPTRGTILVDGKNVATETHAVKSIIGVQLQSASFFEQLSLRELLVTFAAMYDRIIDPMAILTEVQLAEKANAQVKELSGGQRQRFSIAIGLVNDPKILFLDEPTTGLDPQARRNLWELITQIKAKGTTIVLTTHYMDEAEVLCDRIAIMDHAHIVALDTTRNLLTTLGMSSTVEFASDSAVDDRLLWKLTGVQSVLAENGTYVITTTDAQHTLDELFTASRTYGFGIDELMLKRVTLEDVFLKLTGHQLRD